MKNIQVLGRILRIDFCPGDTMTEPGHAWISLLSTSVKINQATTELAADLLARSHAKFVDAFLDSMLSIRVTDPIPCAPCGNVHHV